MIGTAPRALPCIASCFGARWQLAASSARVGTPTIAAITHNLWCHKHLHTQPRASSNLASVAYTSAQRADASQALEHAASSIQFGSRPAHATGRSNPLVSSGVSSPSRAVHARHPSPPLCRTKVMLSGSAEAQLMDSPDTDAPHLHDTALSAHFKYSYMAIPKRAAVMGGKRAALSPREGKAGEDAYSVGVEDDFALVVLADGVTMWSQLGIDAGEMALALSRTVRDLFHEAPLEYYRDPMRLVTEAWDSVLDDGYQGSTTLNIVMVPLTVTPETASDPEALAMSSSVLEYLASGDSCGVRAKSLLFGDSLVHTLNTTELKATHTQDALRHEFGRPYQLGHHEYSTPLELAQVDAFTVCDGDLLVCATDGLFDNVYAQEISDIVSLEPQPFMSSKSLAFRAFRTSMDKKANTPWNDEGLEEHGIYYCGGKEDDITVVTATIEFPHEDPL